MFTDDDFEAIYEDCSWRPAVTDVTETMKTILANTNHPSADASEELLRTLTNLKESSAQPIKMTKSLWSETVKGRSTEFLAVLS
jgi:hypothetical protein